MRGHFSRLSFDPRRHLAAVLDQQGSVGLEADRNEEIQILLHRLDTQNVDIIGACGRPRDTAGFDIGITGSTVTFSPGRLYAGGLLVELEQPLDFTGQPDWPIPTRLQWGVINNAQPWPGLDLSSLGAGDTRRDLFYVEAWLRHKTALNDEAERQQADDDATAAGMAPDWDAVPEVGSLIRERALGGPETGTRLQTVAQVKYWTILDAGITDCAGACSALAAARRPATTGTLKVTVSATTAPVDPCTEPLTGGYAGAENRMYRVEIHEPGVVGTATFKWSNENGAFAVRVNEPAYTAIAAGGDIVLQSKGDDETTALRANDWVELCGEDTESGVWRNRLAQIVNDPAAQIDGTWTVQLTRDVVVPRAPFLRRWSADVQAIAALNTPFPLPDDSTITVTFFDEHGLTTGAPYFHELDYWTWSGRTITRGIDPPDITQVPQHVQGIERAYCCLGIVTWTGPASAPTATTYQCPDLFPPLTDIHADEVRVDDCPAALGVSTVQDVINVQCGELLLRYVSGDGQEGPPGLELNGDLILGVEDGFGRPVNNVPVHFTLDGGGSINPPHPSTAHNPRYGDGIAVCRWTLGTAGGDNLATATIDGGRLPVVFHARGVEEEATGRWPTITAIGGDDHGWTNDRPLMLSAFNAGLRITFSQDMAATSITPSTFIVTLEVPFQDPTGVWAHRALIVYGSVTPPSAEPRTWTFQPQPAGSTPTQPAIPPDAFREWLAVESREFHRNALRCRVVLMGDTILSTAGLPLDGEAFGQIRTDATGRPYTDLVLPSGDGRRGGDFESWFWLVPDRVRIGGIALPTGHVVGGVPVTGTVNLSDVAPADFTVHLTSSDPAHARVPDPLPIAQGQSSATFQIITQPVMATTPVSVTAAAADGAPVSATLTIDPPTLDTITIDPPAVDGGDDAVGTVLLTGPTAAPLLVALGSRNPLATVHPLNLRIEPPNHDATFDISTLPPQVPLVHVQITADYGGVTKSATLTIRVGPGRREPGRGEPGGGAPGGVVPGREPAPAGPVPGPAPVAVAGAPGGGPPVGRRLTDVAGIDGGFMRRLEAAGVTNVSALAHMERTQLAQVLGITQERAQGIIEAAQRLLTQ